MLVIFAIAVASVIGLFVDFVIEGLCMGREPGTIAYSCLSVAIACLVVVVIGVLINVSY